MNQVNYQKIYSIVAKDAAHRARQISRKKRIKAVRTSFSMIYKEFFKKSHIKKDKEYEEELKTLIP